MASTTDGSLQVQHRLTRLNKLAGLLDDRLEIPVLGWKVGLDPLVGLIPGAGDWLTWAASVYIFWEAIRLGVPRTLLVRMGAHIAADLVAGYVPVVGDIVDAAYKANRRNVNLVLGHFGAHRQQDGTIAMGNAAPVASREKGRVLLGAAIVLGLLLLAALPVVVVVWWMSR